MSNDFGNQSYIPSNYLDDYQETISEDQLHHGQGSSSRPWAALRRGNSRASFQERTSLPNDLQFSMPKHRSFGGLETIRAGAVPEAQSTPAWPSSASPSNHSRDPSSPIATRYQTLSARSSQGQSFSQGEDSSSQPFTDSLYENLTAMLTPGWEVSPSLFGFLLPSQILTSLLPSLSQTQPNSNTRVPWPQVLTLISTSIIIYLDLLSALRRQPQEVPQISSHHQE